MYTIHLFIYFDLFKPLFTLAGVLWHRIFILMLIPTLCNLTLIYSYICFKHFHFLSQTSLAIDTKHVQASARFLSVCFSFVH